ncbi:hypothetical protein FAES_3630 [Fibrella aestuarina BUZ 2]|uniref:Uncharacterized protein n=1 Tax=Fibrella aestuarina BUZ 2 TaxID=1166018 RepID=I0KBY4_9BACT|nr:hypothetical protein [Fibrella aestuarina]CCH01637.1 hypothetical protein FAES_3630 [Fibrella aestuarina BUZ 2]
MHHVVMQARRQLRYRGPSGWADLNPKQFLQFMAWQLKLDGAPAGKFALLQLWYKIPYLALRQLAPEQLASLCELLDWTLTLPDRWLLPRLVRGGRLWIGPGDGLRYLPFGAFMFAESALLAYTDEPQPKHLVDLAASLYAPRARFWQQKTEGGRLGFDRLRLPAHEAVMEQLPEAVLKGVYLCYVGARQPFPDQFTHLFKPPKPGGSGGESTSWLDVGLNLASKTGALGTFAELEKQPTFLVLTMLDALIGENERLKQAYNT